MSKKKPVLKKEIQVRQRTRRYVIQALYQYVMVQTPVDELRAQFLQELEEQHADVNFFDRALETCCLNAEALDAMLAPQVDRPMGQLDAITHAVLWLGVFEFKYEDIPLAVVIDEAVGLTKLFGATDAYRFVHAVLHGLARAPG